MDKKKLIVYDTCKKTDVEVEVSMEFYNTYTRLLWKEDNDDRSFYKHQTVESDLIGCDHLDNFHECIEYSEEQYEEEYYGEPEPDKAELIYNALACLDESDRLLIFGLFFNEMTEAELAEMLHVTRQTIINRKKRILAKLKEVIESFPAD